MALVLGVVAAALAVAAVEHLVGWPDALTLERPAKLRPVFAE